jgi:hypothetical protein
MFYRPSFYYIEALRFLNSPIEMRRAAGYYALLDSGRIDLAYLLERYRKEDSPYIKRIIVLAHGVLASAEEGRRCPVRDL